MRTKTCPLFRAGRMLTAVGTFAAVGFHAFGRGIKGRRFRVPALAESADQNLSAFSDGENADCGRNLCCCWLLRIRPRNQRQKVPVPALAESADQNLSAFSDGENADCGRNLCCCWFPRIQLRNRRQKIPVPALAGSADINLSAFSDGRMPIAAGTFAAVGFHAFSRGIKGGRFRSQLSQKVRT